MFNYDCTHISIDEDSARCAVCGWIFECPYQCNEYINYFGKQPYKQKTALEEISEQKE